MNEIENIAKSSQLPIMYRFCNRLEEAANEREDVDLFGVAYTPLPLDADGIPVHVGDVLTEGEHAFTAHCITLKRSGCWRIVDELGFSWAPCDITHSKPDTYEQIIADAVRNGYTDPDNGKVQHKLVERCKALAAQRKA